MKTLPESFRKHPNFHRSNQKKLKEELERKKNKKPGDFLFGVETKGKKQQKEQQLVVAYCKQPFEPSNLTLTSSCVEAPPLKIETKILSLKDLKERFDNDPAKVVQSLIHIIHWDYDLTIAVLHTFYNLYAIYILRDHYPEKFAAFINANIRFREQLKQVIQALLARPNIRLVIASKNHDKKLIKTTLRCILGLTAKQRLPDRFSCISCGTGTKIQHIQKNMNTITSKEAVIDVINNTLVDDDRTIEVPVKIAGAQMILVNTSSRSQDIKSGIKRWEYELSESDNSDDEEDSYSDNDSYTDSDEEDDDKDNNWHLRELDKQFALKLNLKEKTIDSDEIYGLLDQLEYAAKNPPKTKAKAKKATAARQLSGSSSLWQSTSASSTPSSSSRPVTKKPSLSGPS